MAAEAENQNGSVAAVAVAPSTVLLSLKPQLTVTAGKAEEAVQFYKAAFGAEELSRVSQPKRKAEQEAPLLLCADIKIGSSSLLVCDQNDETASGKEVNGVAFRLEAEDVAAAVDKAVKAGGALVGEISADGSCGGENVGTVKDPFGFLWVIAPHGVKSCDAAKADA